MQKPWIKNLDITQDLRMSFHAQFPTVMRRFNVSPGGPTTALSLLTSGLNDQEFAGMTL